MAKTAIMIDGGFLSKLFKKQIKRELEPADVINICKGIIGSDVLFRIYYYDCAPCDKSFHNPIDSKTVDFAQSISYTKSMAFQRELAEKDFIAFRKGELRGFGWKLRGDAINEMRNGKPQWQLKAKHLQVNLSQKGLDMRIGLDIASLSTKRIVEKIAIVTGDTDFIPAMKYARKEGCLITVINIGGDLTSEMRQHADFVVDIDLMQCCFV